MLTLILLLSLPGYFNSRDLAGVFSNLLNYITTLSFFVCTSVYASQHGKQVNEKIVNDLQIYVLLSLIPIIYTLSFVLRSDMNILSPYEMPIATSGMNARSNKWSHYLAIVALISIFLAISVSRLRIINIITSVICIILIFYSMGRSGILGLILGIYIVIITQSKIWVKLLAISLLAMIVFISGIIFEDKILALLKLNDFASLDWNKISSNRLNQYRVAINIILNEPITGVGLDKVQAIMKDNLDVEWTVHNLFLRIATESGILLSLLIIICFVHIYILCLRLSRSSTNERLLNHISLGILTCGLTICLFEPNTLVGSFNSMAIWWFIAGLTYSRYHKMTD